MNITKQTIYPDDLILSYLNNELGKQEQADLEKWLSEEESHRKYFYEMTEVWLNTTAAKEKKELGRQAYKHFKVRIEPKREGRKLSFLFTRVAVAIVLGGMLLGAGYYLGNKETAITSQYTRQTVEVPMGSRSRIVLLDGTIVWLNAGSRLSYDAGFSAKDRKVKLEGEGYFEVTHNEKLPFIVTTSDVDVKVLGTKFSVKAYDNEENIEVILAEGSVNFINKNDLQSSFLLKPEQQAVYNRGSGKVAIRKVLVSQANIWTTGSHFFNDLTLREISDQLEKSFNVRIFFRDEDKKNLTFYGDFKREDSLDDILMIMSSNGKFSYRKTEDMIEIY